MNTDTLNDLATARPLVDDVVNLLAQAVAAETAGDVELNRACLQRAVALDRNCQTALLNLAVSSLDAGDTASTFAFVEEAARVAPLPEGVEELRTQLFTAVRGQPELDFYLRAIGRAPLERAEKSLSIVILAGQFEGPVSELAHALVGRGHEVRVLTPAGGAAGDEPAGLTVFRNLAPLGTVRDNAARVRTAVAKADADVVLASGIDAFGFEFLQPALERSIPVLHWLDSARPGFSVDALPQQPGYALAPVSDWTGTALRNAGYETARMDTLHPGAAFDRSFRLFLPDTQSLRIGCVSPLAAGRGLETLIDALAQLQTEGIEFSVEIVGDAPDSTYLAVLEEKLQAAGCIDRVRFFADTGAEARRGLLARNNVLVYASPVQAGFDSVQVEALAAGVVLVASGAAGGREIVRDQTDGLLFPAGNAAELAEKLATLSRDGETLQRLQRAGQARAQTFSAENAARKFEALASEMKAALEAANSLELAPVV